MTEFSANDPFPLTLLQEQAVQGGMATGSAANFALQNNQVAQSPETADAEL